jgi:heavy metal sensor kinase
MRRLRTLRVRFGLWVAGLLLAVLVVFGFFIYWDLANWLYASLDDSLRLSLSQALATVNTENGAINLTDLFPDQTALGPTLQAKELTIRLLDVHGTLLGGIGPDRNLPVSQENLAQSQRQQVVFQTLTASAGQDPVRFCTAPFLDNGQFIGYLQVGKSLGPAQGTLDSLLISLLLGGLGLIVVAGFGGYFLAARALAPIDKITRTARRISAEDLSSRLHLPDVGDEISRLGMTIDEMLGRLETSFQRERQFTADASHELRTPLTAMQAILSVTRSQPRTNADYEQALTDLNEETDRLVGLVEDLLQLARRGVRQSAQRRQVDLSVLLRDVADTMRLLAESKGLTLTCKVPSGLILQGDPDELVRLFFNLLDNAVKYSDRGRIDLSAQVEADRIRVDIKDEGIGIPSEHLPHLFERFYRVDPSRSSRGSGLGLAIAMEIAESHGGTIRVQSTPGRNTTVTVFFAK